MSIDYKRSLLVASEKGDLSKVENYLKKVPVDVTDEQNQTALHYAAANGHELVVMHLIKKGAGLECKNYTEWTPLMFASYYGHLNVVALLVHNKAEININNQRLATPLTCAARCGHKAVIEFLLDNGADCNMNEAKENKPSVTPLMAAAQHGHTSIVSLLLQYGMNVDYQNPDTGYTALMLAAMNGHLEIVELLVKNGSADVNLHNCRNQTAYQLSVIKQRKNVEEYLRERTKKRVRISPSSSNSYYNLIDLAKDKSKYDEIYRLLQQPEIDVNVRDDNGGTPLIYASLYGHLEIVELLLKSNANTDIQDTLHGWTALMQATLKKHVDVVKILLHYKADISIRNHKGWTVFELATIVGEPQITRLLCPRGIEMQDLYFNSENDEKGGMKTWITKVGGKMGIKQKNSQTLSRVAIQCSDIENGSSIGDDEIDTQEETDGLRKTSSVLSVLDANKSTNGTAKAIITFVSPQVKLPDDVVAPVLPPYTKFPSFDLPKMPIKGSKLSSSHGSGEVSPYNSSNDSASLQQMTELNQARLNRGKQNANTSFKVHHEPDSPQSSMTSSGLTSISQFRGQPIMPSPLFQNQQPAMPFSKPAWPASSAQKLMLNGKPKNHPIMLNYDSSNFTISKSSEKTKLPDFQRDMSVSSVVSEESYTEKKDIDGFLNGLNLARYRRNFDEEEVDMDILKEMNEADLKSLAIDKTLDRQRILNALSGGDMNGGLQLPISKNKSKSHQSLNVFNPYESRPPTGSSKGGSVASTPGPFKLAPLQYQSRAQSAQSLVGSRGYYSAQGLPIRKAPM